MRRSKSSAKERLLETLLYLLHHTKHNIDEYKVCSDTSEPSQSRNRATSTLKNLLAQVVSSADKNLKDETHLLLPWDE